MAILTCNSTDGWEGIARALQAAQAGDVVRVGSGAFAGEETLHVPDGVRLEGSAGTTLIHSGHGPAVALRNVRHASVADLHIESLATGVPCRVLPEDPAIPEPLEDGDLRRPEWGIVWVDHAEDVTLDGITVAGMGADEKWVGGIVLRSSRGIDVTSCAASDLGLPGICLWSTTEASIADCEIARSTHGILLARSLASLALPRGDRGQPLLVERWPRLPGDDRRRDPRRSR